MICVSGGVLDSLSKFVGRRCPQWSVILNPLHYWPPQSPLCEKGSSLPLVIATGRLNNRQKGFDLLIQAHAKLCKEGTKHRLAILGEGPDRKKLEDLIQREEVSVTVSLPGFVSDVWRWYDQASLLVLSSHFEGLPTVIIEALARGLPVVATDCVSGPREILKDGEFGKLVAPGNFEALAEGIREVLLDEKYREQMAAKGPLRARDFSPDIISGEWEILFEKLLEHSKPSSHSHGQLC